MCIFVCVAHACVHLFILGFQHTFVWGIEHLCECLEAHRMGISVDGQRCRDVQEGPVCLDTGYVLGILSV